MPLSPTRFLLFSLLLAAMIVAGCGSTATYAVGDCLLDEVSADGTADKVSCSDKDSFTVEKLAASGGQPDCGYDRKYTSAQRVGIITIPLKYVTDAVSGTTYCGPANFDPYGAPFPPEAE